MKWLILLVVCGIVLKLVGLIDLSWGLTLSPVWLPIVIEVLYIGGVRTLEWLLDNGK